MQNRMLDERVICLQFYPRDRYLQFDEIVECIINTLKDVISRDRPEQMHGKTMPELAPAKRSVGIDAVA